MFNIYLTAYTLMGLATALATMRIFPPMEGFRPGITIRLLAVTVFTALWPILVSLAAWYLLVGHFGRNRISVHSPTTHDFATTESLPSWQGSKPR